MISKTLQLIDAQCSPENFQLNEEVFNQPMMSRKILQMKRKSTQNLHHKSRQISLQANVSYEISSSP